MAAVIGSLAVLGAIRLYWRRALLLWAAGAILAVFVVLDMIEIAQQLVEGHATLVTIAAAVAVLHIGAAAMAVRVATTSPSMERATAS